MKKSQLRQIIKEEIQQLLKEDDPRVSSINIGDKFQDEDTDIWTVKDIFIPEWTTEVETITLENEDGESTVWPDDFDGGGFFEWFNQIEDVRYSIDYEKDIGGGEYENDTKTFTSKSEAESFAEEHYGVIEYEKYSGDERVEYGYVSNTGELVPETNRRY